MKHASKEHRGGAGVWLAFVPYAVRRWRAFVLLLGTLVVTIGLTVLQPWPMKVLVDHVLSAHPLPEAARRVLAPLLGQPAPGELLVWCAGALGALFIARWGLGLVSTQAGIALGQRMVADLTVDLFTKLERQSLAFHRRHAVGDLVRRVTKDSACVSLMFKDTLIPALTSVVSLVLMFTVMWKLDATLSLVALGVLPWMLFVLRRYLEPMAEQNRQQQELEGRLFGVVEQTLSSVALVQAFTREDEADERFRATSAGILAAAQRSTGVQLGFKVLAGVGTAVASAGVLWLGALHVLDGRLSVGGILVFLAYLGAFYGPLETLVYAPLTLRRATGSAERVLELLETPPDVLTLPSAPSLSKVRGEVVFDGVTFGYGRQRAVVSNISLVARPGETVAIVGPTGAGKSTLAHLLLRFSDPWSGTLSLDGRDLRSVTLRSLRENVALVAQDAVLLPLTIAENIAYARPSASRAEVVRAATEASADSFIRALPHGYDTLVGERGATLSGGERQRIAIARALLKDAPVLVLDEPTSSLDPRCESEVMGALERLMVDRTTLLITHRLSILRADQRIVVLSDGRIVETGNRDQLLARSGPFARLSAHPRHEDESSRVAGGRP